MRWLLGAAASVFISSACQQDGSYTTEQIQRGDNFAGRCGLVVGLAHAPLDADGYRYVIFRPFVAAEGFVSFYAPMEASPMDDAASDFYGRGLGQGVGQVTHYLEPPATGAFMANCLSRAGLREIARSQTETENGFRETFSAVYADAAANRTVAIKAEAGSVGLLVSNTSRDANALDALSAHLRRQ